MWFNIHSQIISMFLLGCLGLSIHLSLNSVNAKEIVATNEWQLIEEGDSIPKGLHVRMNLETGKKWAKLISEDDDDNDSAMSGVPVQDAIATAGGALIATPSQNEDNMYAEKKKKKHKKKNSAPVDAVKITQLANAQLSADASARITSQLLEQSNKENANKAAMMDSIASLDDFEGDLTKDELDYEMMYRTLMSLPVEELDTVDGGMPERPDMDSATDEEISIFAEQIREIWAGRQKLLKEMEEEYLADITDVISERIESLKDYLGNPMANVRQIMAIQSSDSSEVLAGLDDLSTFVGVLKDLEYQLTDLDNARDFHSMGGWPLLVALMTDSIHGFEYEFQQIVQEETQAMGEYKLNNATESGGSFSLELSEDNKKFLEQYQRTVWEIQGLICWCIGTAVKNVEEFHSWALDDFSDLVMVGAQSDSAAAAAANAAAVNVITILLDKFDSESEHSPTILGLSPVDSKLQMRRKYEMYALGSLLRGNRDAIDFFGSDHVDGAAVVYKMFNYLTSDGTNISALDLTTIKLVSKMISLTDDLIMDITLHPTSESDRDSDRDSDSDRGSQLLESLTAFEWCIAPLRVMKYPSVDIQRKMVESMINMAPHCSLDTVMDAEFLIDEVVSAVSSESAENDEDSGTIEDEDLNILVEKFKEVIS